MVDDHPEYKASNGTTYVLGWQNWVLTCCLERYRVSSKLKQMLSENAYSEMFVGDKKRRIGCSVPKKARKKSKNTQKYKEKAFLYEQGLVGSIDDVHSKEIGDTIDNPFDIENKTNFSINLFEAVIRLQEYGVQYNSTKFPAIVIKFRRPSSAVLVFSTGNMVCTGAKDELTATYLVNYMVGLLRTHMYPSLRIAPDSWKIENVVADTHINQKINVFEFSKKNRDKCNYEPEIFSAATYRKTIQCPTEQDKKIVILIFGSGKIVFTGAKKSQQIIIAFKETIEEIIPYIYD